MPMTFTYEIDAERRLILEQFRGTLERDDVVASVQRVFADPAYEPTFDGIVFLPGASVAFGAREIVSMAQELRADPRYPRGRWAVVVDTPLETALAILFQEAVTEAHQIRVFSTSDAACEWLGADRAAVRRALQR